jgi:hypothetical protein
MHKLWICALLLLVAFSGVANADTVALTNPSGPLARGAAGDQLWGWIFDVAAPITVTSLGVFDNGSDGLAVSHDVGIFDVSTHALLESTTVPSGTAGTLISGFRFQSVSPFQLTATETFRYAIVMTMPDGISDSQVVFASSFTTAAGITWLNSAYDGGSTLAFPNPDLDGLLAPGIFGPNFTFTSTPEPSTFLLMGSSILGLCSQRKRFMR